MTYKELVEKYGLNKRINEVDLAFFFLVLDRFYCEFTKEQVHEFINDFYDNADNVFNEVKDKLHDMFMDSFAKVIESLAEASDISLTDLKETTEVDTNNSEDNSRKA